MKNIMEASVIVSHKNRIKLLKKCLQSIEEHTKDVDYKLYIIDAGSSDGSREYLKEKWSDRAELIFEKNPSTYAESNNRVMKLCDTSYIYLLNNDCLVRPGWLRNAIDMVENDKQIGHVASLVLFGDGMVQSHGANITKKGNTHCCYSMWNPDSIRVRQVANFAYAGLGLYRKDLLEKLGYLPEYPSKIYWSDTGWGMKVWRAGFDVRYCPKSEVVHFLDPSERQGHSLDIETGRRAFMKEWGDFLEKNNGFAPDFPFTKQRPWKNGEKINARQSHLSTE
ncbi:MAG: putative glycosyl transferase [bacterium ADurb.Bin363]|nr:MAG: putative glycosyl transferase [bacterium ADurb.Bin363]